MEGDYEFAFFMGCSWWPVHDRMASGARRALAKQHSSDYEGLFNSRGVNFTKIATVP